MTNIKRVWGASAAVVATLGASFLYSPLELASAAETLASAAPSGTTGPLPSDTSDTADAAPSADTLVKEDIAEARSLVAKANQLCTDLQKQADTTLSSANDRLHNSDDSTKASEAYKAAEDALAEVKKAQDRANSAGKLASLAEAELSVPATKDQAAADAKGAIDTAKKAVDDATIAQASWKNADAKVQELHPASGSKLIDQLLEARCFTAICFDNGTSRNWLGIEPLVELPVGKSFSLGSGALSDYVNNHEIKVDLAAGLRVWAFRDLLSFSVYLSKSLSDAPVRLTGSSFVHPASALRRPYPGMSLGLLYDSLWLGLDRDELHNGDSSDTSVRDASYPPNAVIASSWTFTLAIQPFTSFRTAIGLAARKAGKE